MYELKERIKYSQLDPQGKLSLRALLDLYQDCATMHSEDAVAKLSALMEARRGWFVVFYHLKNYRLPIHGERVAIKTYPTKIRGFMGFRAFVLESEEGEILAEAYSEWVHMDLDKLSPARVDMEMVNGYGIDEFDTSAFGPRKISLPESFENKGSFLVDGAYLDTNGHMNNAYYIIPALKAVSGEEYPDIRIEFKKSAVFNDEISINCGELNGAKIVSLDDKNGDPFCVVEFKNAK